MPEISVIVPCLNMKKYIEECLTSIGNQTLREIEVFVVDAGSSDGTWDILERFAQADARIRLMRAEKKSYGYQVNLGIRHATGHYVAIVDADDRIAPDMYETLYEYAVCAEADYVKGTAKSFYTLSQDFTYYMPLMQFPGKEYRNGAIEMVPAERPDLLTRDNFLWYGIFRREFMKGILLHESPGAAFQDLGGLLQTQMRARKAVYIENAFYEYRQDNAASSVFNPKGFRFVWEEYTWAERFLAQASDAWKAAFYRKLFLHMSSIYATMAASGTVWEDSREPIHLIREKLRSKLEAGVIKREHFREDEWKNLQLLLENEKELYEEFVRRHLWKQQQFLHIERIAAGRHIVIFGYGNTGTFVYAQIKKHGLGKVAAFCDNQREKQGDLFDKIPVLSPAAAVCRHPEACFVIAGGRYAQEMERQLISMKVSPGRICSYTAETDMRLFGTPLKNQENEVMI